MSDSADFERRLAERAGQGLLRVLRTMESASGPHVQVGGRTLVNFASNNYLDLADHPHVITAAKEALDRWGWGAGASRLVCGHALPHAELERRLAAFKRTEAALVCPTGYAANLATIRALAGSGDLILLDRLNHGSIVDAAFGSGATVRVFPHRDYDRLEQVLQRAGQHRDFEEAAEREREHLTSLKREQEQVTSPKRKRGPHSAGDPGSPPRIIIVTDSIFSMDGDVADLPRLVALKERYGALLVVDEAHATGVWGERGAGVAEAQGVESGIDVIVGTLSKALGGIGGFIAASRPIIEWIINTAGPFIYTTAIPPAACAAAEAALDLVEREPARRQRLLAAGAELRDTRRRRGWNTRDSCSQIIPVIVGDSCEALSLSQRLEADGLLVPAIRPPTVARGTARLRISLNSGHTPEDLARLAESLGTPRSPSRPAAPQLPC